MGLRSLAVESGLRCDAGISTDCARILRVPNTRNYKTDPPRPVVLDSCLDTDYNFEKDLAILKTHAPASPSPRVGAQFGNIGRVGDAFRVIDVEPITVFETVTVEQVAETCPWIKIALITGGKNYDQPQWNLTTLCATFMEDGEDVAHRLGDKHPGYKKEATDKLWARKLKEKAEKGLGPPSCKNIQANGSNACAACPLLARNSNPIVLAREATVVVPEATAGAGYTQGGGGEDNPPPEDKFAVLKKMLPDEYTLKDNKVCWREPVKLKGEVVSHRPVPLFASKMWDVQHLTPSGLTFTINLDKGRERRCVLTNNPDFTTAAALTTALAREDILPLGDAADIKRFFVSFIAKLNEAAAAQEPVEFGWRRKRTGEVEGFVYGGMLIHENGTTTPVSYSHKDLEHYIPRGDIEQWRAAAKLVTDRKRPELNIIMAIPFASPIMEFTGEKGALIIGWGPGGTGKSFASKVAAAVWGHPLKSRESLKSTENSVLLKLGKIKNLPAYWDDIQDITGLRHLKSTAFVLSQGIEKSRTNSKLETVERGMWATLLMANANISFIDFLVKEVPDTSANLMRVFEYRIEKLGDKNGEVNNIVAGQMLSELERNYGHIGMEYAKVMAEKQQEIVAAFDKVSKRFGARVKAADDERLWVIACSVILVGAQFAQTLGVDLDPEGMEDFLVKTFRDNRIRRNNEGVDGGTERNTEAMLFGFLNKYTGEGHTLWTDIAPVAGGRSLVNVHKSPLTGRELYLQFFTADRKLRILKSAFRNYVAEQKAGMASLLGGLKEFYGMTEAKVRLGGGTDYVSGPQHVLEFPIPPGSALEDIMTAYGKANEN